MSNILQDAKADFLSATSSFTIPITEDISSLLPVKGSIVYNLQDDPVGAVWYSNGLVWKRIVPGGILGFPVTNPPPPALLPNAGIPIFNSGSESWTVYTIGGDASISNTGESSVNALNGAPIGPFTSLSTNQLLVWNGLIWTNADPPAASPSGPAGGALTGTYPNPSLLPTGVVPGTYGSFSQTTGYNVNSSGQLTTAVSIPISNLGVDSITNVVVQQNDTIPTDTLAIVFSYQLPDGWNLFKFYVSWYYAEGTGGTFEYSGGIKMENGLIAAPPFGGTYGATLQTVFGEAPTIGALQWPVGTSNIFYEFRENYIGLSGIVGPPIFYTSTFCRLVYVNVPPPSP